MMKAEGLLGHAVDRIGGEPISARMARKAPLRHLDATLLFATLALATFGSIMVYSATSGSQAELGLDPATFLKRHVAYAVLGSVILLLVAAFDYRYVRAFAPVLYGATILTLILVLTPLGDVVAGARRWIDLGFFQAQPSELAKVGTIVAISALLAERKGELRALDVVACLAVVAVPTTLIMMEPDLGTSLVFAFITVVLLHLGGARLRHLFVVGLVGIIATFAALQTGLIKDYQKERLTAFLDATPDIRSEGYNLTQSKIAIASGGFRGKGLGAENTQTALNYVPEQHTDFIFTAVGEQLGFLGSATLLGLFAFLIWRALRIASLSRDLFGMLVAGGVAALWIFQIFVNMGMTMGIMPITGIPLPFISFGGSSMITNFVAVGLLLNIHMRRHL